MANSSSKGLIDTSVINSWNYVGNGRISDDGTYFCYEIYNMPIGESTLVVQCLKSKWKKTFIGAIGC